MSLENWENYVDQIIEESSEVGGSFESFQIAVIRLFTAQRALVCASLDTLDREAFSALSERVSLKIRELDTQRKEYTKEYLACLD